MKGSISIKRAEIWRPILILFWVLSIIKADDAIRDRHDFGSKREEKSSIHTADVLTLDMVKERMDRQQNIFDRIDERMEDVPAVEHSRSRADGRRCSQEDIECRHFQAALEKDIETQSLPPTPVPTPAPTDRPNGEFSSLFFLFARACASTQPAVCCIHFYTTKFRPT